MNPKLSFIKAILVSLVVLLVGCTERVERAVEEQSFPTVSFAVPGEEVSGYSIAGLVPGMRLSELKERLGSGQSIDGENGFFVVTDVATGVEAELTLSEAGDEILAVKGQKKASLEKDGTVILRTGDPAEKAQTVLPQAGSSSDKVYPGPSSTLIVSVNESVFSFRLVENEFLESMKKSVQP